MKGEFNRVLIVTAATIALAACSSQGGESRSTPMPSASSTVSATACTPTDLTEAVNRFFSLWNANQAAALANLLAPDVATTISTEYRQGDQTPSVSGRSQGAQLIAQQLAAHEQISYGQLGKTASGPPYRISAFVGGVEGSFPDGQMLAYSDAKFGYDCVSRGLYVILLWTASPPVKK